MKVACIAFTPEGLQLATRLQQQAPGLQLDVACGFGPGKADLRAWTEAAFRESDALLFIGAAGIAVRAIAPLVRTKTADPAVVVMDEAGQWAIPLLSGHIGGANLLARQLARASGGQAVLTTATDVRGLWAVDDWAARRGLKVADPARIKEVSGALLAGKQVRLHAEVPLSGELPAGVVAADDEAGADVVVGWHELAAGSTALHVVVPCIVAGIGCRKGVSAGQVQAAYLLACEEAGLAEGSVREVVSIDVKACEEGLLEFCAQRSLPFSTLTAAELSAVRGSSASSGFVQRTVGVDNVCERAALSAGGQLVLPKLASDGVTVALARVDCSYGF